MILENKFIQAEVLPELGGKIWSLLHKSTGTQWLWHNPRVTLKPLPQEANYDENWAGGWEELFPNDAPGLFQGRDLPDHGEWWNSAWQSEILEDAKKNISARLWREGSAVKTSCEKLITLEHDSSSIKVSYRIKNNEAYPLHFLFKQHLALAVSTDHRLELPGGTVFQVDPEFGTRLGAPGPFSWPLGKGKSGEDVDLSVLPPDDEGHREFVYVSDLPEGWCGARDTRTGAALRMSFDRKIFPHTWLFMALGGWRGLYTVVLEPCTNKPKDLNEALRLGQCASLEPGKTLECDVTVALS